MPAAVTLSFSIHVVPIFTLDSISSDAAPDCRVSDSREQEALEEVEAILNDRRAASYTLHDVRRCHLHNRACLGVVQSADRQAAPGRLGGSPVQDRLICLIGARRIHQECLRCSWKFQAPATVHIRHPASTRGTLMTNHMNLLACNSMAPDSPVLI